MIGRHASGHGEALMKPVLAGIAIALAVLLAELHGSEAQPVGKLPRIGFLGNVPGPGPTNEGFRQRLRDLGHIEGRTVRTEDCWFKGQPGLAEQCARRFVCESVDVILAVSPAAILTARQATTTIPIVMLFAGDPIKMGLVTNLARPGGNVTGLTWDPGAEASGKAIEFVRELLPGASRIALLWNADNDSHPMYLDQHRIAAARQGARIVSAPVRKADDLEAAFRDLKKERAEALIVLPDQLTIPNAKKIMELAGHHRLPTVAGADVYKFPGAVMSHAPRIREMPRRAAEYVDKILKGARAGELPIEQPTSLELIVYPRAAKALGLAIPPTLLLRADQVIE